jgi:nitrous oxide reductase accessory protein NosL
MPQMFQTVAPEKAILVQSGEEKHSCVKCGMNLVKFYKTSHAASKDGKHYQYCSIHCLAEHLDEGNELKNPKVVDVTSLEMIGVFEAHYVVGSKIRGTMSRVSKYAFKNLEDAQEFQKKNGGKILDFKAALEVAREDFK